MPRAAGDRQSVATGLDRCRNIMQVVGRMVAVRMTGMPFLRSTVFVAMVFVDLYGCQFSMALDLAKDKRGRIV